MNSFEQKDRTLNLEEEADRQKKYWRKNHIWTILLVVAAMIYFAFSGTDLAIVPEAEEIIVTTPAGEIVIDHDDVTAIAMISGPNYGTCLEGQDTGKVWYGSWENEAWGEYYLGVNSDVEKCIVIMRGEDTVVINFVSESETDALYEYLQACCENAEELT